MKILINTPSLKLQGGVANHYLGLKDYWKENILYNTIGKRSVKSGSGIYWLPYDIIKFIIRLLMFNPDIILLNPSFGKSAIRRDSIFLKLGVFFNKKVVILIHGWDQNYVDTISRQKIVNIFNKSSLILVLANSFKSQLLSWGINVPIELTTTKIDNKLLDGFDINTCRKRTISKILFLSRVEKEKGIYIAIDAFCKLLRKYPYLRMNVVGGGSALHNAKEYVKTNEILNINFTGNLNGKLLKEQFKNNDIYILPTYGEGMPTSVLEAMAFGMPIITRPVGGLVDFFLNEKMGEMIESLNPDDFALTIDKYIKDEKQVQEVSLFNYQYAQTHFMASKVASQLELYCKSVRK